MEADTAAQQVPYFPAGVSEEGDPPDRCVTPFLLTSKEKSRPRVRACVLLPQMPHVEVGIDLRGRQAHVPEHFLNRTEIGTMHQHVGGEAVPEYVWRDAGSECQCAGNVGAPGPGPFKRFELCELGHSGHKLGQWRRATIAQ